MRDEKEKQIRINNTMRKYESQRGGPCIPNYIVPNWGNGINHELVKWWVCAAIATGKHLTEGMNPDDGYWGYEITDSLENVDKEKHKRYDGFSYKKVWGNQRLVWENDHAGESCSYITEAIDIQTKVRTDVIRVEDNKRIEIMDKNVKEKICTKCDGNGHIGIVADPDLIDRNYGPTETDKQAWKDAQCPKCKGSGKIADYPDNVDVVVI